MKKRKVVECSAGYKYSLIKVKGNKGYEYYSCGDYQSGKLGLGKKSELVP